MPPAFASYSHEHTKKWSAAIASYDGYVFITPEYNHGPSAALKNAIDYLFPRMEQQGLWFCVVGSSGGVRAVEQLRQVAGEVMLADVRAQVALSLFTDFENFSVFKPAAQHEKSVNAMLDQLVAWTGG